MEISSYVNSGNSRGGREKEDLKGRGKMWNVKGCLKYIEFVRDIRQTLIAIKEKKKKKIERNIAVD